MLKFFKNKISNNDPNQMGFLQKLAMKKFASMSEEEKMKVMQKMLTPENIAKNKDKILAVMKEMQNAGQISADQVELTKQKLGL